LGELGIPGLVIFGLVWLRWFQMGLGFLRRARPGMAGAQSSSSGRTGPSQRAERDLCAPAVPGGALHRLGTGIFFGLCGLFLQSQTEWVYRQTAIFLTANVLLGTLASLYQLRRQRGRYPSGDLRYPESEKAEHAQEMPVLNFLRYASRSFIAQV